MHALPPAQLRRTDARLHTGAKRMQVCKVPKVPVTPTAQLWSLTGQLLERELWSRRSSGVALQTSGSGATFSENLSLCIPVCVVVKVSSVVLGLLKV